MSRTTHKYNTRSSKPALSDDSELSVEQDSQNSSADPNYEQDDDTPKDEITLERKHEKCSSEGLIFSDDDSFDASSQTQQNVHGITTYARFGSVKKQTSSTRSPVKMEKPHSSKFWTCGFCGYLLLLGLPIVGAIFIIPFLHLNFFDTSLSTNKNTFDDYYNEDTFDESFLIKNVELLREDVTGLKQTDWEIIGTSFYSCLRQNNPDKPAIILLCSFYNNDEKLNTQRDSVNCLSQKITTIFNSTFHQSYISADDVMPPIVDSEIMSSLSSNNIDMAYDSFSSAIRSNLQTYTAICISEVNKLPGALAMVLHTYCDDSYDALFPRAAIILSALIKVQSGFFGTMNAADDSFKREVCQDKLLEQWTKDGTDIASVRAIIGRVVSSVVIVSHNVEFSHKCS